MAGLLDGLNLNPVAQQTKTNTNNAMRTVRKDSLTPIDATTARLNEGVAKLNQNDTSVKERIGTYRTSIVEQLDSIVGSLSGGLLNTKAITKAIKVDANGVRFDTDNIISAVGSSLGFNIYGQSGAMRAIGDTITGEFNRLTGLNLRNVLETNDGSFRVNGNWRTQLGTETLNMLRDYAGIDEFVDVSIQTSFYNSIIYNTSLYGMKDAYKNLWTNYPYMAFRQDAFIQAMRNMITNGDIESIDVVVKLLDEQGRNTLLNKYPTFVETLFSKFTFDDDMLPEDYGLLREKLLDILNIVIGPDWPYRETQFGKAFNLGITSNISPDMVTLLSPVEEFHPLLVTRGMFVQGSALSALNDAFPGGPVTYL